MPECAKPKILSPKSYVPLRGRLPRYNLVEETSPMICREVVPDEKLAEAVTLEMGRTRTGIYPPESPFLKTRMDSAVVY